MFANKECNKYGTFLRYKVLNFMKEFTLEKNSISAKTVTNPFLVQIILKSIKEYTLVRKLSFAVSATITNPFLTYKILKSIEQIK